MDDLIRQSQLLIQAAPQHQVPAPVMRAVAAILVVVAKELDHLFYYVPVYPDQSWLTIATPPSPQDPDGQSWIPAFGSEGDGEQTIVELSEETELGLQTIGVVELLFLCMGLKQADGLVFYDTEGDRQAGKTVARAVLQHEIHQQLAQLQQQKNQDPTPPPNLA